MKERKLNDNKDDFKVFMEGLTCPHCGCQTWNNYKTVKLKLRGWFVCFKCCKCGTKWEIKETNWLNEKNHK